MIPNAVKILLLLLAAASAALASLWVDQTGHLRNSDWIVLAPRLPDFKAPEPLTPVPDPAQPPVNYSVIVERPIFAPDRKPPPPPAPPAPPDPFANLQIRGIITGEYASILAQVDGKVRRIKVNESVGSWLLKSIDGRQVTFVQGTESRQIQLAYAKLGATVPPPPPQPKTQAASQPAPSAAPSAAGGTASQRAEDETRDRIRRLNEARAKRGQAPISYP
jgi:hypothetical protein